MLPAAESSGIRHRMNRRVRVLAASVLFAWCLLGARLVWLQVWQHSHFANRALRQQRYVETIPARPGDILDRRGRLLATTVTVRSLYADPSRMESFESVADSLAKALSLDRDALLEHLETHRDRQFLWIKRRLDAAEEQRVVALDLPAQGCGLREEFRRRYPHGKLAAHVLGWRNIDGHGCSGVERGLDQRLSGSDGKRVLIRDARGYVLTILEELTQPPSHGQPLVLTLDLDLQWHVENTLDRLVSTWNPMAASAVVLDPDSGEVLAMACRPTFDPNDPADFPADSWINRVVSRSVEPGSTIKPLIAAWALQNELVDPDEIFDCSDGELIVGKRILHDTKPHGQLDLSGILVASSNIGMARVGERIGNEQLHRSLRAFGFGRRTGIELDAESAGLIRPLERWDHYSTGSIPMGQEFAATPLQLIAAHAALANGGRLISPHLTRNGGPEFPSPGATSETSIVDSAVAKWMVTHPLRDIVQIGTGRQAAIDGVSVFAKTGTAQVFDQSLGRYSTERYVSSCVCGAPVDAPSALVLVTVEEAQTEGVPFGGVVAAPSAAEILRVAVQSQKNAILAEIPGAPR